MPGSVGSDFEHAARLVAAGQLVAFGTETVYGLGANALNAAAVAKVFEVKRRPAFDPLIVHLANRHAVGQVAESLSAVGQKLAAAFWPGPLTLVVPKKPCISDLVTSGLPTVGVRVPAPEVTRQFLAKAGVPVAAPSANLFGRISPTTAEHVVEQLGEDVAYVLDIGPCGVGIESTVVDVTNEIPVLLRPGGITLEAIEEVAGSLVIGGGRTDGPQRGPGLLSKHYSPSTPLVISDNPRPKSGNEGLITLQTHDGVAFRAVEVLSAEGNLTEAATRFFAALRRLDALGLDRIVAMPFPEEGLGRALNDRLTRAAARS